MSSCARAHDASQYCGIGVLGQHSEHGYVPQETTVASDFYENYEICESQARVNVCWVIQPGHNNTVHRLYVGSFGEQHMVEHMLAETCSKLRCPSASHQTTLSTRRRLVQGQGGPDTLPAEPSRRCPGVVLTMSVRCRITTCNTASNHVYCAVMRIRT